MSSFVVDQSITIRQVSMKVNSWNNFIGMRLMDEGGKSIVNEEWSEDGKWADPKIIPEGNEIIGLKWVNTTFNECIQITRLGFLLWLPNPNILD